MTLHFTILGCGSSGGVPRIGNHWGDCDPSNPKNRRRRCSLLVRRVNHQGDRTTALIDTSPDVREQLLDAGVGDVDGVLYTHEHADHIHGIDDLRMIALNRRERVPIYAGNRTLDILTSRFDYCFQTPPGSQYPPILDGNLIEGKTPVTIDGAAGSITAIPFDQEHGAITSFGYRIGKLVYSCDVNGFSGDSIGYLQDLDVWIIDALRRTYHPSHFSLDDTLEWIDRIKPRRAIITNMHVDLDYEALCSELPEGVEPAYDGMEVTLDA